MKNTLKPLVLLSFTLGQLLLNSSQAETYYVDLDVDVTVGETPLNLVQVQNMRFPQVKIDNATQEGATCFTNNTNNVSPITGKQTTNADSLCPGLNGQGSIVELSGSPNAVVNITQSAPTQVENGIAFQVQGGTSTVQLSNTEGKTNVTLVGVATLKNKQDIASGLITFSYDITAAYQ